MMSLTAATFATAGVLAGFTLLLSLLQFSSRTFVRISASANDFIGAVVVFIGAVVFNAAAFAWFPPIFHAGGWLFWAVTNLLATGLVAWAFDAFEGNIGTGRRYRDYKAELNWPNAATVLCGFGIVGLLLVGWFHAGLLNTLGQDRATQLADRTHVETPAERQHRVDTQSGNKLKLTTDGSTTDNISKPETKVDPNAYPATDTSHIPVVTQQAARYKAEALLSNDNIGTRYDLESPGEQQVISGQLYYIYTLTPAYRWYDFTSVRHVEYYITVSAENPDADAKLSDKSDFKCYAGGRYGTNIQRVIYRAYPNYFVSGLSAEVSDDGQLYYTASLNQTDVRWEHSTPVKAVVVNATTCDLETYDLPTAESAGDLPTWVDRVFSTDDASAIMNWYGRWGAGPKKAPYHWVGEKPANRTRVAGEPNLVFTNEGPAYQFIMVSRKTDGGSSTAAAQNIVLMDTRSGAIRVYAGNGVRVEASLKDIFGKITVPNVAQGVPDQAGVYQIKGHWVWVGGMVPEDKLDVDESISFAGIGMIDAKGDKATAVIDTSWNGVLAKFEALPAVNKNADPSADADGKEVRGEVSSVKQYIQGGNTKVVIRLTAVTDADGKEVVDNYYYSQVIGSNEALGTLFVQPHDKVLIGYSDDGSQFRSVDRLVVEQAATKAVR
jgi:hypothetical protein